MRFAEYSADVVPSMVQRAALHSWQTVHGQLLDQVHPSHLEPNTLASMGVYHFCVYKAFGGEDNLVLANSTVGQLAHMLADHPWLESAQLPISQQLDQACALAWLDANCADELGVCVSHSALSRLDKVIWQVAEGLLSQPQQYQHLFVRVARYLYLRLPAPGIRHRLHDFWTNWTSALDTSAAPLGAAAYPLLGLMDGLAAELLVLIRAYKIGVQHPSLLTRLQQGLQQLLATKRDVNFLEQQYSVFPYQLSAATQAGLFSAELSWRRGDVGQSWLLYEAQAILCDVELANMAELIGFNTLLRTNVRETEIAGASFYGGAAGVAQLYAYLYQISKQPAYRTAYYFWLGRTQDFLECKPGSPSEYAAEPEILGGLVGTGLVLLTAAQGRTLNWHDILI